PSPPDYESHLQAVYEALLDAGDIALDVGAHTGRHAIPMARRVAPAGKVYAFEPLPGCRSAIRHKLEALHGELRPVLEVCPAALARLWAGLGYVVCGLAGELLAEADLVRSIQEEKTWDYVAVPGEDARAGEVVGGALRRALRMAAVWGALSGAEELTAESLG